MTPIALLKDDFTSTTRSPLWALSSVTGSATLAQTGGQAILTLPSSTAGAHSAAYATSGVYDFTGDGFYWDIATMVNTGVIVSAYFQLLFDLSGANQLYWQQLSNSITVHTVVAGVNSTLFTATWSSTTYKYLRIRESAGTIYWDSSTNGTSWTNRASVANPFAVTGLYVQFSVQCGNVVSPGSLRLDDVNLILPAPSSTWRETTADWSITNRFKPVTLAATANAQGALVTADTMDSSRTLGGTLHYFGGPVGSTSGGYLALTEYASLALAQASPFQIPVDGRVDLPALVDARYMRLYHRSTDASAHTLREFVPRRIVQAEDIEAESIRAINIAADAVTADKIFVLSLSAITASMGALHMDGPIDITTGSIVGGAGVVTLSSSGLAIDLTTVVEQARSYQFRSGGVLKSSLRAYLSGINVVELVAEPVSGGGSEIHLFSDGESAQTGRVYLRATGNLGAKTAQIDISASSSVAAIDMTGTVNVLFSGVNVGTATGATAGQISTSGSVGVGEPVNSQTRLHVKGQDSTSSNYAIVAHNSSATTLFYIRNDSTGYLANTAWTYSSDATKKKNIRALGKDIVDWMKLEPRKFDYIDGPTNRWGFIAQDVQTIFPDLIEAMPDGSLGMRTDEINVLTMHVLRRLIRILVQKGVLVAADIA